MLSTEIIPLQMNNLTEQVYDAISSRIMNGTFRPGERLDVNRLAEQLKVSPTPVKNALSLLGNEGLVQIVPRSGTFVTQLSRRSLEEMLPIRLAYELVAAETIVQYATQAEISELTKRVDAIATANDVTGHYHLNAEFHQHFVELSGNLMLATLYRQLNAHIHIALIHSQSSAWKERITLETNEHMLMMTTLEKRDLQGLKEAITAHLQRSRQSLLKEIKD